MKVCDNNNGDINCDNNNGDKNCDNYYDNKCVNNGDYGDNTNGDNNNCDTNIIGPIMSFKNYVAGEKGAKKSIPNKNLNVHLEAGESGNGANLRNCLCC